MKKLKLIFKGEVIRQKTLVVAMSENKNHINSSSQGLVRGERVESRHSATFSELLIFLPLPAAHSAN